jgi:sugar/nucleoside kinase (ribokinase family)
MESSLKKRVLQRLQELDKKKLPLFHIVMLPDFFVDHFVSLDTIDSTCKGIKFIVEQGGGNIPGVSQRIQQGGNAANTALGIARLGMSSHLICRTNTFGLHLLQYFLGKHHVDLSGVKADGALAITTALEFQKHSANVMIGDAGSVATFHPDILSDHDYELITSASLVGVTNWNLNRFGTALACKVFDIAHQHKVKTFFDSSDPSPRITDLPDLMEKVLMNPKLDIFGLNENELHYYTDSIHRTQAELIAGAESLKRKISARIDLHTAFFSCSIGKRSIVVPTLTIPTLYRITGAGDAWNAANIFADVLEFPDDERLLFANIFAGQYISSPDSVPPTIDMIIDFIKKAL